MLATDHLGEVAHATHTGAWQADGLRQHLVKGGQHLLKLAVGVAIGITGTVEGVFCCVNDLREHVLLAAVVTGTVAAGVAVTNALELFAHDSLRSSA